MCFQCHTEMFLSLRVQWNCRGKPLGLANSTLKTTSPPRLAKTRCCMLEDDADLSVHPPPL